MIRSRTRRNPDADDEAIAEAMLAPFIEEVATKFAQAGLSRLDGLTIRVSARDGGEGRHFGACRTDGRLILFRPALAGLPQATILGIVAHELGHAADFLYPGRFVLAANGRRVLVDDGPRGVPTGERPIPTSWLEDWERRDDDAVERAADQIAETVLGVPIGYAGPCLLQTLGAGIRPRPDGLR